MKTIEQGQVVKMIIKGNVAADVKLTAGGMAFIRVAAELADEEGNALPVQFLSVKCWGTQAQKSAENLRKGDRVTMQVWAMVNTYQPEDGRPIDPIEYRLESCELVYKKKPAAETAPVVDEVAVMKAQLAALADQLEKALAAQAPKKTRKSKSA